MFRKRSVLSEAADENESEDPVKKGEFLELGAGRNSGVVVHVMQCGRHCGASEAVRLFAAQGVAGTSGEEVARNVGVSVRTLWRYFPTKESFVEPVLADGVSRFVAWLREWPAGRLPGRSDEGRPARHAGCLALATLIRLTRDEPLLCAVWLLHVHHDAEPVFAEVLAARAGGSPDDLAIRCRLRR